MKDFKVDFFVIGAARSGTTSLYNYLNQHPDIFLPNIKELNHFSKVSSNQPQDYKKPKQGVLYHTKIINSFEVYQEVFEEAIEFQQKGDISPSYLWGTETAQRIYNHNPEAKIVLTLRNPVDRAFSHYVMNRSVGYDTHPSFKEALEAPQERIWGGGNLYLEWSSYYAALKSYFEVFPKENIKILIFEAWTAQKKQTLCNLFQFLKVDETIEIDFSDRHNQKVGYKNIKTLNFLRKNFLRNAVDTLMPQKTKENLKNILFQKHEVVAKLEEALEEQLKNQFKEEVIRLEELTGVPLQKYWGYI